jgi:hypothetical protein
VPDCAAAAEAAEPAASDSSDIVETLLGLCISSSSSSTGIVCDTAQNAPAEWKELQHAVATAVGQRSIERAVGSYVAAAAEILPHSLPTDEVVNSSNSSSSSTAAVAWRQVVSVAVCTADVLVAGIAAGCYTAGELEQELLEQMKATSQTVAAATASAGQAAATTRQGNVATSAAGSAAQQQQQQLCQLLAGAVLHALLTSSQQKLAVWAGQAAGGWCSMDGSSSSSSSMAHFVRLPAVLMKVARDDGPLWLLQQLRTWLQAATLGSSGGDA